MHIDTSKIQTGTYEPKLESFDKNTSHKFTLWTDTIQITVILTVPAQAQKGKYSLLGHAFFCISIGLSQFVVAKV